MGFRGILNGRGHLITIDRSHTSLGLGLVGGLTDLGLRVGGLLSCNLTSQSVGVSLTLDGNLVGFRGIVNGRGHLITIDRSQTSLGIGLVGGLIDLTSQSVSVSFTRNDNLVRLRGILDRCGHLTTIDRSQTSLGFGLVGGLIGVCHRFVIFLSRGIGIVGCHRLIGLARLLSPSFGLSVAIGPVCGLLRLDLRSQSLSVGLTVDHSVVDGRRTLGSLSHFVGLDRTQASSLSLRIRSSHFRGFDPVVAGFGFLDIRRQGFCLSFVCGLGDRLLVLARNRGSGDDTGCRCTDRQPLDEFFDIADFFGFSLLIALQRRRILAALRRRHDVDNRADENER